jgi:hypothetical protein
MGQPFCKTPEENKIQTKNQEDTKNWRKKRGV